MEIKTNALKLLVTLQRPLPRGAATIGAWLNIWQVTLVAQKKIALYVLILYRCFYLTALSNFFHLCFSF